MRVVSALIAVLFVTAMVGCGPAKKQAPAAAKDSIAVKLAAPVAVDTTKKVVVDTTKKVAVDTTKKATLKK